MRWGLQHGWVRSTAEAAAGDAWMKGTAPAVWRGMGVATPPTGERVDGSKVRTEGSGEAAEPRVVSLRDASDA